MQVSVEKVNNVERRLTIVVPANQVEEAYTNQIKRLVKTAHIKGFRPGKAPVSHIKQRFGDEARRDALTHVMQNALYEAIKLEKLTPISAPQVEPKLMVKDQPLEFVASFEVLPEIGKIQFATDGVERPVVEVGTEDVSYVIEQLRKQHTKWQVVDAAAEVKNRVVIDYYAVFEGKADIENKVENFPLELGSQRMLPGFEEGLIGSKAGEERTLGLHFPADFKVEDKAGKPVDFVVQVKQVFVADVPPIDESFIQRLGVANGNEEDLKQQIKQALEQECNRLVKEKLKEQVFKLLLEQNPLEVPNSLIEREAKNIHDEVYPPHQHHDHHQHSDTETTTFNEIAKKRVALGLLMAEYAKQEGMKPDQGRLEQRVQEIAAVYEEPQEVVKWLLSDERRSGLEAQVLEDQVMDKLLESTTVIDKIMTYVELKGIRI